MKEPIVSVILPTYNGARFIAAAIQGVLHQSFKDLELIVVDDGSRDATPEIVGGFQGKDPRVIYKKNALNLGIQKTLNAGLLSARGKYVARIDDDDTWSDAEKLSEQVRFLEENQNCVLIGTGAILIDENGKELGRYIMPASDAAIRARMLQRNCFVHSSVLFRKDAALRFGGYSENAAARHVEDYDLWLKMGTVGMVANLPLYGVKFMLRAGAISARHKVEQFKKDIALVRAFRGKYPGYTRALIFNYARLCAYGVYLLLPIPERVRAALLARYKQL